MSLDTDAGGETDLATAVGLYVLGELSLGKAAERAGVDRWEFEERLRAAEIPVDLGPRDRAALEDEVDTALDLE